MTSSANKALTSVQISAFLYRSAAEVVTYDDLLQHGHQASIAALQGVNSTVASCQASNLRTQDHISSLSVLFSTSYLQKQPHPVRLCALNNILAC